MFTTAPHSTTKSSHSMSRGPSQQYEKSSLKIIGSPFFCPTVSPVQMLEIEQVATTEFGITEEMLTENAGRCIAETAREISRATPIRDKSNRPVIVVLAGDSKTGSRAIAAARHLHNQGARVLLIMLPVNTSGDGVLECVRRQIDIYTKGGGASSMRHRSPLEEIVNEGGASADLVIDAMLGMHLSYEDLKIEDQMNFEQLTFL